MNIRLLENNDNIEQYMRCVSDLNGSEGMVDTIENIRISMTNRPQNILTFVMVNDDNTIVATATVIMEKKLRYQRLCCHIEDVGVHPDFRNRGYGAEIVGYCVDYAKKNNCYKIKLNCKDNLIPFYNRLGFKVHEKHLYI